MKKSMLLLAYISLMIVMLSCSKEDNLVTVPEGIAQGEPPPVSTIDTTNEVKIPPPVNATGFVNPNARVKIFDVTTSVSLGQWYKPFYNKSYLNTEEQLVCYLKPISGNPDLYVMAKNTKGQFRYIRYDLNSSTIWEQSVGRRVDLRPDETQLYFGIHGRRNSTFKLEIYKEPWQNPCILYENDFDRHASNSYISYTDYSWKPLDNVRGGVKDVKVQDSRKYPNGKALHFNSIKNEMMLKTGSPDNQYYQLDIAVAPGKGDRVFIKLYEQLNDLDFELPAISLTVSEPDNRIWFMTKSVNQKYITYRKTNGFINIRVIADFASKTFTVELPDQGTSGTTKLRGNKIQGMIVHTNDLKTNQVDSYVDKVVFTELACE